MGYYDSERQGFRDLFKSGLLQYVREWMLEDSNRFIAISGSSDIAIHEYKDSNGKRQHRPAQLMLVLLEVPPGEASDVMTGLRGAPLVRQQPTYLPKMIQHAVDAKRAVDHYNAQYEGGRELREVITWLIEELDREVNWSDDGRLTAVMDAIKREAHRRLADIDKMMKRAELSVYTTIENLTKAVNERRVEVVAKMLANIPDDEE